MEILQISKNDILEGVRKELNKDSLEKVKEHSWKGMEQSV